ncbi:unnamed protein product [Ceutorhynchus assimilis]|uniref:Uncharacterized protein n=1 Tax=Ceutorhynchus assimilis TaxID=467358 RepID=A0A9N9MYC1_9CUCU|nr:unnamed protein product [Ceutorhynchus assimilis]
MQTDQSQKDQLVLIQKLEKDNLERELHIKRLREHNEFLEEEIIQFDSTSESTIGNLKSQILFLKSQIEELKSHSNKKTVDAQTQTLPQMKPANYTVGMQTISNPTCELGIQTDTETESKTTTNIITLEAHTQTLAEIKLTNNAAGTQTISCELGTQTELTEEALEEVMYSNALKTIHLDKGTQTSSEIQAEDPNNQTLESDQKTSQKPQAFLITNSEMKGLVGIFKACTRKSYDISYRYLHRATINDLFSHAESYANKIRVNDLLIIFTGNEDACRNTSLNKDFRKLASSRGKVFVAGCPFSTNRPVLNKFIQKTNFNLEESLRNTPITYISTSLMQQQKMTTKICWEYQGLVKLINYLLVKINKVPGNTGIRKKTTQLIQRQQNPHLHDNVQNIAAQDFSYINENEQFTNRLNKLRENSPIKQKIVIHRNIKLASAKPQTNLSPIKDIKNTVIRKTSADSGEAEAWDSSAGKLGKHNILRKSVIGASDHRCKKASSCARGSQNCDNFDKSCSIASVGNLKSIHDYYQNAVSDVLLNLNDDEPAIDSPTTKLQKIDVANVETCVGDSIR